MCLFLARRVKGQGDMPIACQHWTEIMFIVLCVLLCSMRAWCVDYREYVSRIYISRELLSLLLLHHPRSVEALHRRIELMA